MAVHKLKHDVDAEFENTTIMAYVDSQVADEFYVKIDGNLVSVKRAVSCLVLPKDGDKVLCYMSGKSGYILSVLESVSLDNTHLKIDGSLTLETTNDAMIVSDNFTLATKASTSLFSKKMDVSTEAASCFFESITMQGTKSTVHVDNNLVISKTIETVADTSTQRFVNSFRFIECVEQLKAGNLMQSVKNLFSSRSRQAIVLADQDVKIDGERIHMG